MNIMQFKVDGAFSHHNKSDIFAGEKLTVLADETEDFKHNFSLVDAVKTRR
jgi:hypothetical protein